MKGHLITITPEGEFGVEELPDPTNILDRLHAAVQGNIETLPHFDTLMFPREVTLDHRKLQEIFGTETTIPCVAFCNEEGKIDGLPVNQYATALWAMAMERLGMMSRRRDGSYAMPDVCAGPCAIVVGDEEFLRQI